MLNRKGSCSGMVGAADRGRVGERLQAALAGLQELHLLRDRQGDMVSRALRVDQEEPVTSLPAAPERPRMMGAEEQRLEATLSALKQQLSHLRKQDVGLKTHLQQLDQQISELKLDVSKASTEQLESDSRPSSGFYDLSDGGSCSLSNSCTSVYSECLSSSQTSLLTPMCPANTQTSPLSKVVCRRRSTDESTTHSNPPRATGLHLGSSRIRASTTVTEQGQPRPVSTGDLERMMTQGLICYKSVHAKIPTVSPHFTATTADPKFKSNLVSRTEVYQYPSPLHAVALQSPIFSNESETTTPGLLEEGEPQVFHDTVQGYDTKTLDYIDKLAQHGLRKIQNDTDTENLQPLNHYNRRASEVTTTFQEVSENEVSLLQFLPAQTKNIIPVDNQKRHFMAHSSQETADNNTNQSLTVSGVSYSCSHTAVTREYDPNEVTSFSLRKNKKNQGACGGDRRDDSMKRCGDISEITLQERKDHRERSMMNCASAEDSQGFGVKPGHACSPEFVHARFVPAGSQRVKVRQGDRKTKAVKLRRKNSEKARVSKQQHGYSSEEKAKELSVSKGELKRSAKGKVIQKQTTYHVEERKHGSSSDSSHCGQVLVYSQKIHPKPHPFPIHTTKSSKSRRLQYAEYGHPVEQRKKRQCSAKLPSDVEMVQASCTQRQRPKEPSSHVSGSMKMVSMHPRPGQWIGSTRPFKSSMSCNSFHNTLNARYPPVPFHISSFYPPRCESEYSAECASLFHSTIVESSEGEMSDNTTNRFGDSESSQSFHSFSGSDSSLSLDEGDQPDSHEEEGGLVWAEATFRPTAARQTLQELPRSEPSACRIKASRALKKKIRRFQPASLKVMTLV